MTPVDLQACRKPPVEFDFNDLARMARENPLAFVDARDAMLREAIDRLGRARAADRSTTEESTRR